MQPTDSAPPHPRRLLWPALDAGWLAILAAYLFSGLALIPLHADEVSYLWMSRDWAHLALQPDWDRLYYDPTLGDPVERHAQEYRLGIGAVPRMLLGVGWWAQGHSADEIPDNDWDWNLTIAQNYGAGNVPSADLIVAGRTAATAVLALGMIGLFGLGKLIGGRRLAYPAALLFATNPLILLHGRRAMSEGFLIGTTLLAVTAAAYYVARPERFATTGRRIAGLALIGVLAGLAFSSKQTGALAGVAAAAAIAGAEVFTPRQPSTLIRRVGSAAWQIAVLALIAVAASLALNITYWNNPVGGIRAMLEMRVFYAGAQAWTWGGYESGAERIAALLEETFTPTLSYFDTAEWAAHLIDDIRAFQRSTYGWAATVLAGRWIGAGLAIVGLGALIGQSMSADRRAVRAAALAALGWGAITIGLTGAIIQLQWQRYYALIVPVVALWQACGLAWIAALGAAAARKSQLPEWRWTLGAAAVAGAVAIGGQVWAASQIDRPARIMHFSAPRPAEHDTSITYGSQIALTGYTLSGAAAASGGSVQVRLVWQLAGDAVQDEYATIVEMHDGTGSLVAQAASGYDIPFQTSSWVPGTLIEERLRLHIPPGTAPGEYTLHVKLYAPRSNLTAEAAGADGAPLGPAPRLADMTITRPARPASLAALGFEGANPQPLTGDVSLVGLEFTPSENQVGQPFYLTAVWRAGGDIPEPYRARLMWVNDGSEVGAQVDFPLVAGYSSDQWRAGDVWRGTQVLHVPGRLEAGNYRLRVQLIDSSGEPAGDVVDVGAMTVGTPPRSFDLPNPQHDTSIEWANGIRLLGFDLSGDALRPGDILGVMLYWQPQNDVLEPLSVFVHLIDAQGVIVAQQDQVPLGGARPTLGWAPGEVIADPVSLSLAGVSPGAYAIRIGWYHPATGQRVLLLEGAEFTILPVEVEIGE